MGYPCKFQLVSRLGSVTARQLVVGAAKLCTEGATYIRQGDHHVGHWPTFLVVNGLRTALVSAVSVVTFANYCIAGSPLLLCRPLLLQYNPLPPFNIRPTLLNGGKSYNIFVSQALWHRNNVFRHVAVTQLKWAETENRPHRSSRYVSFYSRPLRFL